MNEEKLGALVGRVLQDIGGAYSIPLVRIGEQLGLYKAIAAQGPIAAEVLAETLGLSERYVREWLAAQAAAGYVDYNPQTRRFSMSDEQTALLADDSSPFYLAPAFDCAAATVDNQPAVQQAFRTGHGVAWGSESECLSCAVAKFFRPGYEHHLVKEWLPALDGVVERLQQGARVADVGCGHGISTMIMAEAHPQSEFVGFDFHAPSIDEANKHVKRHGLPNIRFEQALAKEYPGEYDLVTIFDCLHDMGDPAGAMRHVRESLTADGTCMIVEPAAGDQLEDNLNPIGRLFFSASTMICVPTSLAQEVGMALGAQAGEARLREVIVDEGGFTRFRRATETPFNMILEARP